MADELAGVASDLVEAGDKLRGRRDSALAPHSPVPPPTAGGEGGGLARGFSPCDRLASLLRRQSHIPMPRAARRLPVRRLLGLLDTARRGGGTRAAGNLNLWTLPRLSVNCVSSHCGREQITCVQTYIDGVVLRRDVFGSSPAHRSCSCNKTLCGNEPVNQLSGFVGSQAPQRQRFSLGR